MKGRVLAGVALIAVGAAAGAGGSYWLSRSGWLAGPPLPAAAPGEPSPRADGRTVLYWYDPMVPTQRFDKPGKSPFMDMQLVPKYADEAGDAGGVRINPGLAQNLGIRLARVERGSVVRSLVVTATIAFDERDVAIVQSRTNGFVERVYGHAPGDVIRKGAPLVDLLVPDWAGAQTEFAAVLRMGDRDLIAATRHRLELLGMSPELVARIEQTGKTQPVFTLVAPIAGMLQSLDVRMGMTVTMGMTLAKLNGISSVWLDAAVPEAQGGGIALGSAIEAQLPAYPGQRFEGKVRAVLPAADPASRTLTVRAELANRDGRLRPGMVAQARLSGSGEDGLTVPSEAVIRTGRRSLVIVAEADNRFRPVDVQLGNEGDGRVVVLSGLTEGQQVIASGQFLIDSEASLSGVLGRLDAPAAAGDANGAAHGTGQVEAVAPDEITLSHGPIPALGWGPMTMPFKPRTPELVKDVKPGDTVRFTVTSAPDGYVIEQLEKTGEPR